MQSERSTRDAVAALGLAFHSLVQRYCGRHLWTYVATAVVGFSISSFVLIVAAASSAVAGAALWARGVRDRHLGFAAGVLLGTALLLLAHITGRARAEMLTEGDGIETYPVALASGNEVAVLYADARQPQSVAVVSSSGGDARVITTLPDAFPRDAHVVPENITLEAEDGIEFNTQLFLPSDLSEGEQRPALIFIHGGSRRQMLLGYHHRGFYHMAYAMNQYFASQGYVVMSVNYRSGIGYGREFRNAEGRGGQGNTEYRDILAAGKYLQTRGDVDASRVGLWGLSYGGILTAQGLARNSDVFAAGVDIAGVHLWGDSLDPESVSWQASAISEIENWTSPVLLIHGDDDRNVDFSQTVGLVQLLRAHEVEFELMVFPDDVHSTLLYRRWVQAFEASDDFLERKLVRGERVTTQGGNR